MVYLRARFERQRRKLTLKQAAALSKMTEYEVSIIETGRLIPTEAQLKKLAAAYGLPPEELLKQVDDVLTSEAESRQ
jgi:transcriptional regulator with XRE-family HTH domain